MSTKNTDNERPMRTRTSLGIACCRVARGGIQVLVVRKRFTYAFNTFVHGNYAPNDTSAVIALFDGMTVAEKVDVLSLNFVHLWYRVWLNEPHQSSSFFAAKSIYERAYVADRGERLRGLMAKSVKHGDLLWEIPKGRKRNRTEPDVHCAMREFYEETQVSKSEYILFPKGLHTYSYIDGGINYTSKYYIGLAIAPIEPAVRFGVCDQVNEISDIRWMGAAELRYMDPSGRLLRIVRPVLNYVRGRTRCSAPLA